MERMHDNALVQMDFGQIYLFLTDALWISSRLTFKQFSHDIKHNHFIWNLKWNKKYLRSKYLFYHYFCHSCAALPYCTAQWHFSKRTWGYLYTKGGWTVQGSIRDRMGSRWLLEVDGLHVGVAASPTPVCTHMLAVPAKASLHCYTKPFIMFPDSWVINNQENTVK